MSQTATPAAYREVFNFIDGRFEPSRAGRTFAGVSPVDGRQVAIIHEAGRADVEAAVKAARAALKGPWGRMPQAERMAILHRVADGIQQRFDEFVDAECLDTGKPRDTCRHVDIPRGAAKRVFRARCSNAFGSLPIWSKTCPLKPSPWTPRTVPPH